jgi:hypothetical protein
VICTIILQNHSWHSSLANLKTIRKDNWQWLTRLKGNRQANPDGTDNRALCKCAIREAGTHVHLKGYSFNLMFQIDTLEPDAVSSAPPAAPKAVVRPRAVPIRQHFLMVARATPSSR